MDMAMAAHAGNFTGWLRDEGDESRTYHYEVDPAIDHLRSHDHLFPTDNDDVRNKSKHAFRVLSCFTELCFRKIMMWGQEMKVTMADKIIVVMGLVLKCIREECGGKLTFDDIPAPLAFLRNQIKVSVLSPETQERNKIAKWVWIYENMDFYSEYGVELPEGFENQRKEFDRIQEEVMKEREKRENEQELRRQASERGKERQRQERERQAASQERKKNIDKLRKSIESTVTKIAQSKEALQIDTMELARKSIVCEETKKRIELQTRALSKLTEMKNTMFEKLCLSTEQGDVETSSEILQSAKISAYAAMLQHVTSEHNQNHDFLRQTTTQLEAYQDQISLIKRRISNTKGVICKFESILEIEQAELNRLETEESGLKKKEKKKKKNGKKTPKKKKDK